MDFLTRKYGPLPGWAWGAVAAGAALLYFVMRSRSSTGSSSQAASANTLAASPAASAIPFVPSVTVTGIPTQQPSAPSPAGTSNTLTAGSADLSARFPNARSAPLYGASGAQIASVPFGASVTMTGGPSQTVNGVACIPVTYLGISGFADPRDYTPAGQGGGRGGWGMAGQENPVAMMGWTAGWQPASPGPGSRPGGLGGGASSRTGASHRLGPIVGGRGAPPAPAGRQMASTSRRRSRTKR